MRNAKRHLVAAACVTAMVLALAMGAQAAVKYRVTDLGNRGASDINNLGVIVGGSPTVPYMYDNGVITPLVGMNAAYAVNDLGHVVGDKFVVGGHFTGVLYKNGQLTELKAPPGRPSYSTAYALNNSDKVVGTWDDSWAHNVTGGFVWENGINSDTGYGEAYGINQAGDYVGGPQINGQAYVVRDGSVTFLSLDPAPKGSRANAINDLGQVVVETDLGAHAYFWDTNNRASLFEIRQPGSYSRVHPRAINNQGIVVGECYGYPVTRAFVWQNGTFEYLTDLVDPSEGWTFSTANGMNELGQIVGNGTHNGQWAAYLLTPVPEPASMASMLCGIGFLGGVIRRRRSR